MNAKKVLSDTNNLRTIIHMYFLMLTAIFETVEEHKTIEYLSLIRNH